MIVMPKKYVSTSVGIGKHYRLKAQPKLKVISQKKFGEPNHIFKS